MSQLLPPTSASATPADLANKPAISLLEHQDFLRRGVRPSPSALVEHRLRNLKPQTPEQVIAHLDRLMRQQIEEFNRNPAYWKSVNYMGGDNYPQARELISLKRAYEFNLTYKQMRDPNYEPTEEDFELP